MSDYEKMTVADFRAELGKRKLAKPAKKKEMIKALQDDDQAQGKTTETVRSTNGANESKEFEDQELTEDDEEVLKEADDSEQTEINTSATQEDEGAEADKEVEEDQEDMDTAELGEEGAEVEDELLNEDEYADELAEDEVYEEGHEEGFEAAEGEEEEFLEEEEADMAEAEEQKVEDKSVEQIIEQTFKSESEVKKDVDTGVKAESKEQDVPSSDIKVKMKESGQEVRVKTEDASTSEEMKESTDPKDSEEKAKTQEDTGDVHIDSIGEVDEDFTISLAMLEAGGDDQEVEHPEEEDEHKSKEGDGLREEEEYEERPLRPEKLENVIKTAYYWGKKRCCLYVEGVKISKMLCEEMQTLAKYTVQFLFKINPHGSGNAFLDFTNAETCSEARETLKNLLGEKAEIFTENERPPKLLILRAREDFPLHFQEGRHILIKDFPEDASIARIAQLYPNAIFIARVHQAASGMEKKWFYRPLNATPPPKFVPPSNYKTLIVIEFCSSKEAKMALENQKEVTLEDLKLNVLPVHEYHEWYRKEYAETHRKLALERIYKDEDRLKMLDSLHEKREQLNEMRINRRWLEGDDGKKFKILSREATNLVKAIQIDTLIRCKVGMGVPEGKDRMIRHTAIMIERGRLKDKEGEKKEKEKAAGDAAASADDKTDKNETEKISKTDGREESVSRKRQHGSRERSTSGAREDKKLRLSGSRDLRIRRPVPGDRRLDSVRRAVRGRGLMRGRGRLLTRPGGPGADRARLAMENLHRTEQQLEIQRRMLEKVERLVEDQRRASLHHQHPGSRGRGGCRGYNRDVPSSRGMRGSLRGRGSVRGSSSASSYRGAPPTDYYRERSMEGRYEDRYEAPPPPHPEDRYMEDRYRKEERYRKDDYGPPPSRPRRDSSRDYYDEPARRHDEARRGHPYEPPAHHHRGREAPEPGPSYKRMSSSDERASYHHREEPRSSRGRSSSRADPYREGRPFVKRMKHESGKPPGSGNSSANVASVLKGLSQVIHSKMDEIARKAPTRSYATKSTDLSRPKVSLPRAALPRHNRPDDGYGYQR